MSAFRSDFNVCSWQIGDVILLQNLIQNGL